MAMDYVKIVLNSLSYLKSVLPYLRLGVYKLRPYEIAVAELAKGVNDLRKTRSRVWRKFKEEVDLNEEALKVDGINDWLKEVDKIFDRYESFRRDKHGPYAVCYDGYLPKPGIRHRLRRIVNDISGRINEQLKIAKNDRFSNWLGPSSSDADFEDFWYEWFASRNQTMDAILAALEDSNVETIGVYGSSGVGKTTLIKEVAKIIKGKEMFDVVIMVNVTSHPDIRRIQQHIADKLGMNLEEESESGRAARLRERLKNRGEKKTLIILDNMEVKLDLSMLGIPLDKSDGSSINYKKKNHSAHHTHSYAMKTQEFDASGLMKIEDSLTSYEGCKILMISDSDNEQLLLSQMDGKRIPTFHVKALRKDEAETLFKIMTERIGDEEFIMFESLAAQIANKCDGLPMKIVTTAKALKNKSLSEWEAAYQKLESQNSTAAKPEACTKLSFDNLENKELQKTFLICARLGHDALFTDLVRYCIGLGFLQLKEDTAREARERVRALVGKLKELSLLSDSFSSDRFTMHDIIRDAALSIASQHHAFAMTKRKLDEWPDKDKLRRYTCISLQHCDVTDIIEEFPKRINCFRLKVFHLDNKASRLKIPDKIFNEMKELRVLILTRFHLSPFPSSIACLTKLRMLCLEECKLGENLCIIGNLEKLRVLSLSGSDIQRLPLEVSHLAKLQIFDLSNCFDLKEIPPDVLSKLTSLEELYVGNSQIQWKNERLVPILGIKWKDENASLSELEQPKQLATLDIQIPKITHLPDNLFFDKLDCYRIVIGDFNEYPVSDFKMLETCGTYLSLQLQQGFEIYCPKEIKILFRRVESLLLRQNVRDIFSELTYEGFPFLKHLSIVENSKVESIIHSESEKHVEKAFPKLESLFLYEVNNVEHICHRQRTKEAFCKLKTITLKICGQLKNVFFTSMIKHLSVLETIEVSECDSLKEIVTVEMPGHENDEIKFPELRSLMLQSLWEFVGFYTSAASIELPNELFGEKVVIPKLERMKLSSIKIQKIWSDQPTRSNYFQNLMHLDVNDCWNMRYLLSISMSKSLMNLQSLSLSECAMMERIFKETDASVIEIKESIFPKLKYINFRSMKKLRQIWPPIFHLDSFGKLGELIIEGCEKLENVFPSYMVGRFQNLCNLKVTNCKSMKEIFDLTQVGQRRAAGAGVMITSLQNLHVEALPKLKHVWKEDTEGILRFTNLKKIWVLECLNLKHIFPLSVAIYLNKLEYLEVWNCGQLKEIVFTGNVDSVMFELPKLTTTRFSKLPNLESFYGGTRELRCSTLNNLSVEQCHKLKLFTIEFANSVFPEKVICNLKSMQIEGREANSLDRYGVHKLEELQLSRLKDTEFLYFFLHRNPNLKSLLLSNCFFEQLAPRRLVAENFGFVPKLKSLKLMNLPSLKMIGFEEYTVLFRMLECLIIKECPWLNTIAPSLVSFTYLKNLEVSNCNKLSHLMTPSTAKSLVHLITMKVIQCESMVSIIGSEQGNEDRIDNIIFQQLKEIELDALHELQSFSSASSHLSAIEFPSLEKVVVSACHNMKKFTFYAQVKTPNLRKICVRHGKDEKRFYWDGDLEATIQQRCKRALDPNCITFSTPHEALKSGRLKILKLVDCKLRSYAFPTSVFPILKNLEELEVRSSNVEVIFETKKVVMNGYESPFSTESYIEYTLPLKKMTLDKLPKLRRVWKKDGQGIICFQNLQEVLVTNCDQLKTLFPMELVERVKKLEKLEIRHCKKFEEIVEKKNENTEATKEFSFPDLTSLSLYMLPQLKCFYPGRFSLECPELSHLEVLFCGDFSLETFQRQHEEQVSTSVNGQPFFSKQKAIFILESLKLDWKNTMVLCNENFPKDMLHELVQLELDFDDVDKVSDFPIGILEKASNLEYLQISRCRGLEELTPSVHSAVSFSNLKQLSVKNCDGLKHLFTSSTARKLVHLEEMFVVNCEAMKEILAKDLVEEAIKFERLNTIVLDSLPSLSCFYSGNQGLQLSYLISVLILQCPKMKIFSQGNIDAESFMGIQVSSKPEEDLLFHQDLNTTVKWIFEREVFLEMFEKQVVLRGEFLQQNIFLRSLVTLKLDNCTQPHAIPSSIHPYLENLQELEVLNSEKVKVVFEKNGSDIMEIKSQLRKLTLKRLPGMTHFCGKNSYAVLSSCNLQEVVVNHCGNLQTLFPASLAKNLKKLEKLEIKFCGELKQIVEEKGATKTNMIFEFPCLEKMDLYDLPQLTCFYPKTFTLICPTLNKLSVLACHKLELFKSRHPWPNSINKWPLISNLKVISNLKELRLDWKHISVLSSWFTSVRSNKSLLQSLDEISLFFEADENEKPKLPIEILGKASKLRKVSINNYNSPKIFTDQPNIGKNGMVGLLKVLTLREVSTLQFIQSEGDSSSWLNTICEKLSELNVVTCHHLTTLAHPALSFSCLKKVFISNCPKIQYLFTYSAAKTLMNLEKVTVKECELLKEIIAREGNEDEYANEMIFQKLEILTLDSLPKFESFYTGRSTLNFPSLKGVKFVECCSNKLFRHSDIVDPKLKVTIDGVDRDGDIRSVIMQQFEEEAA